MAVGRVVLVAGVLVLLFIPYLLWGTGLMTARSQALLRTEFSKAQQRADASTPSTLPDPAHRAPVAQPAPPILDPAIGSAVGTITIPKIDLSMVVVEGTGDAQLQTGPGHYPGTPLPGEIGNAAIAGHRTTYLHPFYNLNELVPGDPITIVTLQGIFLYHVTGSLAVLTHRCGCGRPDPQADTHLDHLQSALQRQSTAGGARPSGGQHPGPPQARRHQRPDARKRGRPSRRRTRRPHRRTIGWPPSCGGSRWLS